MKGFTLLELLLAIALLGVVIFAATSAQLNVGNIFNIDLAKSVFVRDGSYVVNEIAKMIRMGESISGGSIWINDFQEGVYELVYFKDGNSLKYRNPYLGVISTSGVSEDTVLIADNVSFFEIAEDPLVSGLYDVTLTLNDENKDIEVTLSTKAGLNNAP